jgi:exopolysaccharide production protein ExoZ
MLVTGRELAPRAFLSRRLLRIVPLYWLLTLAIAALLTARPGLFRTTVVTGEYLIKSLLFVPYQNPGHNGDVMPILVPGWSLNMEMMFYLIFGLLLFARGRWLLPGATLIFGSIAAIGIAFGQSLPPVARFLADLRVLEFLFGMYVGWLYLHTDMRHARSLLFLLVAIAVPVLLWQPINPLGSTLAMMLNSVLCCSLIVYAVVAWEKNHGLPRLTGLLSLGDASYSLYLGHLFALGAARVLWSRIGPATPSTFSAAGFAAFGLLSSVVVAIGLYRLAEKPITRKLRRRFERESGGSGSH